MLLCRPEVRAIDPNRPGGWLIAILPFLVKRRPSARPEELSNADW